LAKELLDVVGRNRFANIRVECLPAILHNTPEKIPHAIRERLEVATDFDRVFVAYGDCGTGGLLDQVLDEFGAERLPGAHCYQFYAGGNLWQEMQDAEPGTLYLTDYLARHFDRIVWQGLGLDRWPELRDDYFANYTRVVYLAQIESAELGAKASEAARRLGLRYEMRLVGYGDMERTLVEIGRKEPLPA
jgi:hypothetical protein